ncbi:MAG: hypothetical protein JNL32_07660 [Candidatus Kapabacteria bacterium]|nr:hypothetical protein [Candidatus Kapabacteria bacterium]
MNDVLFKKIRALAEEAFKRRDRAWYEAEVRRVLLELDVEAIAEREARKLADAVQKEKGDTFVVERLDAVEFVTDELFKSQTAYTKTALESIRRSMARGEGDETAIKRIERLTNLAERHARTALNTGRAALSRELVMVRARESYAEDGDPWMQYVGGGLFRSRKFCLDHLWEVRRLSEWAAMRNQFNQPVHIFCGGYNCVHRLVVLPMYNPRTGEGALKKQPPQYDPNK